MKLSIFVLVLGFIAYTYCGDYRLIFQSQERGAACLDGSPPGMYIHEGSGPNRNKFLLFMQGGGSCGRGSLE